MYISSISAPDIRLLMKGDESALRKVYDCHGEDVYQLAFHFLKDEDWSEEIVQDVFLKLWFSRENLDESGNIWLYLYVIAKRLCLNRLREIKRSAVLMSRLMENIERSRNPTEEQLFASDMERLAESVIAALPAQQQTVFKLSREQGLSYAEIAQKLHISPNTVKNHLVQALKKLRMSLSRISHGCLLALLFVRNLL